MSESGLSSRQPRHGTTLIELLTVMTIFSVLMTLILGFYIYAYRVSGSRDRLSTSYRKMVTTMDRVETMLSNSRIIYASNNQLVFSQLNTTQPLLKGGWPNWIAPTTLAVVPRPKAGPTSLGNQLVAQTVNSSSSIIDLMGPTESLYFSSSAIGLPAPIRKKPESGSGGVIIVVSAVTDNPSPPRATNGVIGPLMDCIDMTMRVYIPPENGVGTARNYTLTRTIVLERP